MKRFPLKILPLAVAFLVAPLTASAADGRIPIGTVPYTISASGSYYLTGNLSYSANAPAITISASNVSLDLEGHTLSVQYVGLYSFGIYANGFTNIRVSNGMITGGGSCVAFYSVPGGMVTVEGMTLVGFAGVAIVVGGGTPQPGTQVSHNHIAATGSPTTNPGGINISQVSSGAIVSNQIVGNGTAGGAVGIIVSPASGLIIADNTVSNCFLGITTQPGTAVEVLRNNASQNAYGLAFYNSSGIETAENLMIANTNTGLAFSTVTNCVYRNNTAQGNPTNYSIPGTGVTNGGGNY